MTHDERPAPFSAYTTPSFWDDPHISAQMLAHHLEPGTDLSSRRHGFIDRSTAWLGETLGLGEGSRVLDLGCGPGLYALRLARRGVRVRGVDVSRRSLLHLEEQAAVEQLPVEAVHGSYLDADLGGPHDAAILIYEDYCVLSPEQRSLLLERVRGALAPGGRFVFDVTSTARFEREIPMIREFEADGGFWALGPHRRLHERWTYPEVRLVLDRFTITADGEAKQFWNWMQCLTPGEVEAELAAAGFTAVEVFGDVAGAPYDEEAPTFAVLAEVSAARGNGGGGRRRRGSRG